MHGEFVRFASGRRLFLAVPIVIHDPSPVPILAVETVRFPLDRLSALQWSA